MMRYRCILSSSTFQSLLAIVCTAAAVTPLLSKRDRDSARKAKRVSEAVLMYLEDYDEMFPVGTKGTVWNPKETGWVYAIKPYLKSFKHMLVRRDPRDGRAWPSWLRSQNEAVHISFVSNGLLRPERPSWGLYGVMGLDQSPTGGVGGWMIRGRMKLAQVTHPSTTIMVAEAFNAQPLFFTGAIVSGVSWWDSMVGFGGLAPDPKRDGTPYKVNGFVQTPDNRDGAMNYKIDGKSLFIWCDGHVSMLPPIATNSQPAKRSLNLWDALRP
jgi:hypothetical protein